MTSKVNVSPIFLRRQTSVAVVVHLPAELVASAGGSAWWTSSETSPVLLIVLGILLGLLCLVISALTIYVCHWSVVAH